MREEEELGKEKTINALTMIDVDVVAAVGDFRPEVIQVAHRHIHMAFSGTAGRARVRMSCNRKTRVFPKINNKYFLIYLLADVSY